ncbi:MAG: threonylcarbamoyl-AMP synthase [Muribaculaceae bacterium]|nr:threonylcarbamoyl-AMP synthase [Muribaculaceae bacterium]MDE6523170.1 threonylcarbamoyl-AMP synthase [Muribaculaceae bacterium]
MEEKKQYIPVTPQSHYDEADLKEALRVLKEGGIILYPTDTVWGIGCDARNPEAVEKIFKLKERADSKSMLVLVGSEGMLQRTVKSVPEIAWQLIDVAVNPMTIIYDYPVGVADNLKADDGSLGIRITTEKFSRTLCERMRGPIVSTSANKSGKPTPMTFSEISSEIKNGVDYVCKFRQKDKASSKPSNIIKITKENIVKVIR